MPDPVELPRYLTTSHRAVLALAFVGSKSIGSFSCEDPVELESAIGRLVDLVQVACSHAAIETTLEEIQRACRIQLSPYVRKTPLEPLGDRCATL